jgi:membrane protein DedA with SNARE-associated domain
MVSFLMHVVVLAAVHGALRDVAAEVARYGYVVLFVLIAAESFGFPLPGEISLLVGAYEVQRGAFALPAVILVGAVAAVAGDNAAYLLGRRAGRHIVERLLRRLRVPSAYLDRLDAFFRGHAGLTVAIARQLSPVRGLAALSAGGTRVPWQRFFIFNALACVVWATSVTLIATQFVGHLDALADDISLAGMIVAGVSLAVAAVLLWRYAGRRLRRRRSNHVPAAGARPAGLAIEPRKGDDLAVARRRDDDLAVARRRDDERRLTG